MPHTIAALIALSGASLASAQTVDLAYRPTGALNRLGFFEAQTCTLSPTQPPHVTALPPGARDVLFGVIRLGPRENRGRFAVLLTGASTSTAKLYLDSDGDGDFTNDEPALWKQQRYSGPGEAVSLDRQLGSAPITITYDSGPRVGNLNFYRMDPKDPARPHAGTQLFYYRDYGFDGSITVGKYTYKAFLSDDKSSGDFRGPQPPSITNVTLYIDLNGNNRLDRRTEAFDPRKPVVIGEQVFEVQNLTAAGDALSLVLTRNKVEIKPPTEPGKKPEQEPSKAPVGLQPGKSPPPANEKPAAKPVPDPKKADMSIGSVAPAFTNTDLDGATIRFPDDYKGKLVILDFWATWCRPCRDEIPNVVAAYDKLHARGLEIIGVSLDQADKKDALRQFLSDNKMPWKQVYDGKYWSAEVARTYQVRSIPAMYLIDGDTGTILSSGNALRGGRLVSEIEKALAAKKAK